ncbi:MAG: hypothetical protein Q8N51_00600 [Gammaproteobacteria bacterium]|nr:hypothetical protein [Gammaproteobacteria bacterium]
MTKIEQRRKLIAEAQSPMVGGHNLYALHKAMYNGYAALLEIAEAAQEQVRHPNNPRSLEALSAALAAWEQKP